MTRRPYRVIEDPAVEERLRNEDPELIDLWFTFVHQVLALAPADEHGSYDIAYVKAEAAYRLRVDAASGSFGFVYYQVLEDERLVLIVRYSWWRVDQLQ